MKLLDVVNAPWAIQPEKLLEIHEIYRTHLRGDKIDFEGIEARMGRPLANEPKPYEVVDGVALISMEGVMAKRANLFMRISGGVSTELVRRDLAIARADGQVHSIILMIDSPGGSVDGTQSLANDVYAARHDKPIVTLASGMMASGGVWVGSSASKVYIADETTIVGSIGVVVTHTDISRAEEQRGVKTSEITAGKYKRIASSYSPLSEDGRASIQEQVDYLYSIFVGNVARNRGVDEETVLKNMADGRLFIGKRAIEAGLVDGVSTLDELIAQLNRDRAGAASGSKTSTKPQGKAMSSITREQLQAESPELFKAILAEGHAAGATAERARIKAVEEQLLPGHEALINTMKYDGKSTAGDAAVAINAAERTSREAAAKADKQESPKPVASAPAPAQQPSAEEQAKADAALPVEERCKKKWDADAGIRAEFGSLATYTAYVKAEESGAARIKKAG